MSASPNHYHCCYLTSEYEMHAILLYHNSEQDKSKKITVTSDLSGFKSSVTMACEECCWRKYKNMHTWSQQCKILTTKTGPSWITWPSLRQSFFITAVSSEHGSTLALDILHTTCQSNIVLIRSEQLPILCYLAHDVF